MLSILGHAKSQVRPQRNRAEKSNKNLTQNLRIHLAVGSMVPICWPFRHYKNYKFYIQTDILNKCPSTNLDVEFVKHSCTSLYSFCQELGSRAPSHESRQICGFSHHNTNMVWKNLVR